MPRGKHSEGHRESTPAPSPTEESHGPRRAALRERRRRRRKRNVWRGLALAVVVAATVLVVGAVGGDGERKDEESAIPRDVAQKESVRTLLMIGTRTNERDEARVVWVSLVSIDPGVESGAIVYIPAHTAVEVPGRGLQGLDDSFQTGGVPLLLVSVENLLGITVDGYLELAENDALVLFQNVGELTVDVPNEVRVSAGRNKTRLLLTEGPQVLAPPFLVDLLYRAGVEGDDIALGSRHLAFWDALFDAYAGDPEGLAEAVRDTGGALAASDTAPGKISSFFDQLVGTEGASRSVQSLPVTPLEVPGNRLYAVDPDELEQFMTEVVGESASSEDLVRVQILNGNGVPGIGQEVASLLVGHGFRVILSGNAPRLNYQTTRVITYDSSEEGQALAQRAQELLGVGEVEISAQEQGIVDLTVVVGKDFLRTR